MIVVNLGEGKSPCYGLGLIQLLTVISCWDTCKPEESPTPPPCTVTYTPTILPITPDPLITLPVITPDPTITLPIITGDGDTTSIIPTPRSVD